LISNQQHAQPDSVRYALSINALRESASYRTTVAPCLVTARSLVQPRLGTHARAVMGAGGLEWGGRDPVEGATPLRFRRHSRGERDKSR